MTAVAVLICLVVVTLISGVLLKVGLAHRDSVRAQERRLQAEWLAQAGLDRALFRLAASAGYTGETWQLSAADLGLGATSADRVADRQRLSGSRSSRPARVPNAKLIKVQADYPPDPPHRARHSLQIQVELDSLKTGVSR